jgi:pyridoxal phosphate enzyme (YggS family)
MNHWREIRNTLPADVTLVAVSKYHSAEQIAEAYAAGCRDFGESRVQELKLKQAALPKDIRWHFIGHLQTNKVRDLLRLRPYLIQSVDSEHLLRAIDIEAGKQAIVQDILLELHVAAEETKSGMSIDEFNELLNSLTEYPNIHIRGIMGMATNTDDEPEIRRCFHALHEQYLRFLDRCSLDNGLLSMGMSDDYSIALSEGSTMVRIGSAIFD